MSVSASLVLPVLIVILILMSVRVLPVRTMLPVMTVLPTSHASACLASLTNYAPPILMNARYASSKSYVYFLTLAFGILMHPIFIHMS